MDKLKLGQRLLLAAQGVAPLALKLPVILRLGPQRVAELAPHLPGARLRELILALPVDFLAKTAVHLDPRAILDTYLSLPDSLHLEVARQLCADRQFATAARYAECLSPLKIRVLIIGINNVDHVMQIAHHIEDLELIVQAVRTLSGGYLAQLTLAAERDANLAVSVRVLSGLSPARQAEICGLLPDHVLQQLLPPLLEIGGEALRERLPERLQVLAD